MAPSLYARPPEQYIGLIPLQGSNVSRSLINLEISAVNHIKLFKLSLGCRWKTRSRAPLQYFWKTE